MAIIITICGRMGVIEKYKMHQRASEEAPPCQGKEPRKIGNPQMSSTEYRREHGG